MRTWRHRQNFWTQFYFSWQVKWSKFHVNIIACSGVMTVLLKGIGQKYGNQKYYCLSFAQYLETSLGYQIWHECFRVTAFTVCELRENQLLRVILRHPTPTLHTHTHTHTKRETEIRVKIKQSAIWKFPNKRTLNEIWICQQILFFRSCLNILWGHSIG